jgi:hypothetical protein
MSDIAEREKLQADAGLPHLTTELTYELRMAVTGHRADEFLSWGYQWTDKPHRLVHEACGVVEAQAVEIARLRERLEIDPSHPYDGIYCRDETIRLQDIRIASLKAEVARARVREQELADEANRLLDEVKASDKKVFYLTAEVERKDAALNILQAAMTAKKPIPMPFKVAIIEARAALTPAEEKTDV